MRDRKLIIFGQIIFGCLAICALIGVVIMVFDFSPKRTLLRNPSMIPIPTTKPKFVPLTEEDCQSMTDQIPEGAYDIWTPVPDYECELWKGCCFCYCIGVSGEFFNGCWDGWWNICDSQSECTEEEIRVCNPHFCCLPENATYPCNAGNTGQTIYSSDGLKIQRVGDAICIHNELYANLTTWRVIEENVTINESKLLRLMCPLIKEEMPDCYKVWRGK